MSDVIEGDGSGSPSIIEDNIEAIEDEKVEVKKKKPYVLSPLRLEALAKAREKAFSLRKEFHDNKEPRGKKEKIKKKSKLEVELENRELKKAMVEDHPQVVGDGSGSSPSKVNEKVVEKEVEKVDEKVVEKVVDEKEVEKEVEKVVEKVDKKVPVKTRPSFVKNENGFFCI